jgi:hypothetical protein
MDTIVTPPIFGYRVSYRWMLEIQARLLPPGGDWQVVDLSGLHDAVSLWRLRRSLTIRLVRKPVASGDVASKTRGPLARS